MEPESTADPGLSAEDYIMQEFGSLAKFDDSIEELYDIALRACVLLRRAVNWHVLGITENLKAVVKEAEEFLDG